MTSNPYIIKKMSWSLVSILQSQYTYLKIKLSIQSSVL